MREVGEVLHTAKSGRLIISLETKVDVGVFLLDSKGKRVARVVELIGPVTKPYASAARDASSRSGDKGQKLYIQ